MITWLIVGLVAGVLADLVLGGYGVLADIVVGIAGAFIGGWLFASAGWRAPFPGLPGAIAVAFVGSLLLLAVLRLVRRAGARAPR